MKNKLTITDRSIKRDQLIKKMNNKNINEEDQKDNQKQFSQRVFIIEKEFQFPKMRIDLNQSKDNRKKQFLQKQTLNEK